MMMDKRVLHYLLFHHNVFDVDCRLCYFDEVCYVDVVLSRMYPYSIQGCRLTCLQRHIISECSCGDSHLPLKGTALGTTQMSDVCQTSNTTQCM
jgi:hypothetical protein